MRAPPSEGGGRAFKSRRDDQPCSHAFSMTRKVPLEWPAPRLENGRAPQGVAFEPSAFRQHGCGRSPDCPHQSNSASASVAQWQSRASPAHRHGFDSCRPHQSPFAWEANLVKARPSEAWLRQDVEAAERWARNLPQAPCHPFAGSDSPFSPSLRARGAGGSGPLGQNQLGHAQGPRISLARRLSTSVLIPKFVCARCQGRANFGIIRDARNDARNIMLLV